MKILWIVNSILNDLSLYLYNKPSNGVWMDALLNDFKNNSTNSLVVATTYNGKSTVICEKDSVKYYALPNGNPIKYNENKKSNIKNWEKLIKEENPDVIQVWGTEFTHGLCALRIANKLNIKSVIYMQGYLKSISRYYLAGIDNKELKGLLTFRDFILKDSISKQKFRYEKYSKKELEMLKLSNNIITENDWCHYNIKAHVPTIKNYTCPLSINEVFSTKSWDFNNINKHSIMCTASGYTIKGLHMVFRACSLLKKDFPDIKVYVPGTPQVSDGSFKGLLRKRSYTKYIEKLINSLDIKDNIIWPNYLSQGELAEVYSKSHVFVMSSSIENHSSSLKEAMMVGVPCITSYVGGIPEYVKHGESGFLYRFEEYEMLAYYVSKIFNDEKLATLLSKNAKEDMLKLHDGKSLYEKILTIYNSIYKGE